MQPELFTDLPEQFTLYLARHGSPDRSRYDIPYHIPPGPELTPRGREEAAELGVFLHNAGVVGLQASPFERAWRTAAIANEYCSVTLETNPDLAEWRTDEIEKQVLERMQRAFYSGLNLAQQGPVALVSHGGPVMTLLKWLGLPKDTIERHRVFDSRNMIPVAGAWRVERLDGELRMALAFAPSGIKIPADLTV